MYSHQEECLFMAAVLALGWWKIRTVNITVILILLSLYKLYGKDPRGLFEDFWNIYAKIDIAILVAGNSPPIWFNSLYIVKLFALYQYLGRVPSSELGRFQMANIILRLIIFGLIVVGVNFAK